MTISIKRSEIPPPSTDVFIQSQSRDTCIRYNPISTYEYPPSRAISFKPLLWILILGLVIFSIAEIVMGDALEFSLVRKEAKNDTKTDFLLDGADGFVESFVEGTINGTDDALYNDEYYTDDKVAVEKLEGTKNLDLSNGAPIVEEGNTIIEDMNIAAESTNSTSDDRNEVSNAVGSNNSTNPTIEKLQNGTNGVIEALTNAVDLVVNKTIYSLTSNNVDLDATANVDLQNSAGSKEPSAISYSSDHLAQMDSTSETSMIDGGSEKLASNITENSLPRSNRSIEIAESDQSFR